MNYKIYITQKNYILINLITKYFKIISITKQLINFELIMFRLVDKHEKSKFHLTT